MDKPHPALTAMLTVAAALGRLGIPAILAAPNGLITDEATAKALLAR